MSEQADASATTATATRPAGFWIRVLAIIIDGILFGIVEVILALIFGVSFMTSPEQAEAAAASAGWFGLFLFVLWYVYSVGLLVSPWQGTVGKRLTGIHVTDANGQRLGVGRALGRELGKIISAIIFYIGFIMAAFTDRKRGLHDMMAGTVVVYGRP